MILVLLAAGDNPAPDASIDPEPPPADPARIDRVVGVFGQFRSGYRQSASVDVPVSAAGRIEVAEGPRGVTLPGRIDARDGSR